MGLLPKNLLRSLSNLRNNVHPIPNPHRNDRIFKTAAVASAAAVDNESSSKHRLLVRRLRTSGLDDTDIFSQYSPENFTDLTKCYSLITQHSRSLGFRFFCGSGTFYFSTLSPHNSFSPTKPPLNYPPFNESIVVGSCNGLVCFDNQYEEAAIWNPSTNEVKSLPGSVIDRPDPAEAHPSTITTYSFIGGFGYDSKSDDYKYIRWVGFFFEDEEGRLLRGDSYKTIELYSLKTDSWKKAGICTEEGLFRSTSACVNGRFYWSVDPPNPTRVLVFDFTTEKFSYIPFPHSLKRLGIVQSRRLGVTYTHRLFDVGGRLGAVVYARPDMGVEGKFEIWGWNEGWWSLEFDDYIAGASYPLEFSKDGRFLFLSGLDRILTVYDTLSKEVKKVDIYCNSPHVPELDIIPYIESTYSLNLSGGESTAPPLAAAA